MPILTDTDERFRKVVDVLLTERTTALRGMSTGEIVDRTKIPYRTLMRLLPTWASYGVVSCNNRKWPNEYWYDPDLGTAHYNRDRVIDLPDTLTREQVNYIKDRVSELVYVTQATSQATMTRLTDDVWRGQMLSTATVDELVKVISDESKPWQSRANNALTVISILLRQEERKLAI